MKRTIDEELTKWANGEDRKPLLLRGARQVGKTYAVRKLGRKFKRFIELNFDDDPALDALFRRGLSVEQLADAIGAYALEMLVKAGLALKAYRTGANGIPLGALGGGLGRDMPG